MAMRVVGIVVIVEAMNLIVTRSILSKYTYGGIIDCF